MAKKSISSWKQKKNYNIIAPDSFNNQNIGSTLASEPNNLVGRVVTASAKDLTGDKTKQQFDLSFEVTEVSGDVAKTKFKKFSISSGYLRSKVRKRMTKIDYISDFTFGGEKTRVKVMIAAGRQASKEQRNQIAIKVKSILESHKENKIDDIIQMIIFGKLGTEIFHSIKNICPVHRVEIQEIKLL
jgi:small subunit ribosomal protein S3Ae